MDKAPILIAEQLLDVVRRTYSTDTLGSPQLSPLEAYESKHEIEDLCGRLLRSVLGPLEYTTLLAGVFPFYLSTPGSLLHLESCQESSALGFVTQTGVADLLEDKEMSVQEISQTLGVKTKYLSECNNRCTSPDFYDLRGRHELCCKAWLFRRNQYRNNPAYLSQQRAIKRVKRKPPHQPQRCSWIYVSPTFVKYSQVV